MVIPDLIRDPAFLDRIRGRSAIPDQVRDDGFICGYSSA